jgi:oligopeptide transport system substrate-binding protein
MSAFVAKLAGAWQRNDSLVCVGLDPEIERFPAHVLADASPIFQFNKAIVDATRDLVCAYKPQFAHYAAYEAEDQLERTIEYIHRTCPEVPVILDAKRGDVGNTAERYAIEAFERYGADAVTVNPYLGSDSLEPFLKHADRGVVILCRTSNPGGGRARREALERARQLLPGGRRHLPARARRGARDRRGHAAAGAGGRRPGGRRRAGGAGRADGRGHRSPRQLLARHPLRLARRGLRQRGAHRDAGAARLDQPQPHPPMRPGAPRHRALVSLAAALALLLVCGCTRSPPPAAAQILVRGGGPDPDSLDPQKARGFEAQSMLRDLCEGLTTLDRHAAVAPGVAMRWSASADGLTWRFELRPEARWSNGERVVAADFVAALRRLVDPATGSGYAQYVDVIANASDIVAGRKPPTALGVAAPDESTLVVTLATPAPYLATLLSHPSTCPVHRATLAAHPDGFARPGLMLSDGAFVLSEWVQGAYVLALRNRHYWNDAATRLDGVKYLLIPDENAELARYRGGELQVTFVVPRGQFDWIREHLGSQLHIAPQLTTYYYGYNLRRVPFKDAPELRRALSLVIDREKLAQLVLRVGELPAYGWVPPGVDHYASQSFDYKDTPMAARIAEAQRLYREAGYSAQHPLAFELRYNAGEVHTKLALAIASMWKEALGAEVRLSQVEFKSLLQDIDRGDVEMFRSSWVGDYNDAYTFAQYLKSDFGVNLPRYASARYDALLAEAQHQADAGARAQLLEEAERVALADHPLIPLYFYVNKHLVKPEVQGWYDNVMNVVYSKDLSLKNAAK